MSDQNRISPYIINTKSRRQENQEKYQIEDFLVDPIPNSQK